MKYKLIILLFFFLSQNCESEVIEKMSISISYLYLQAATGEIILEKQDSLQIISVNAFSNGFISTIYNVDNKYISTCNLDFIPISYEKEVNQKNIREKKIVIFKHDISIAKTIDLINHSEISYPIDSQSYDIFSLLFAIRDMLPIDNSHFFCLANYNIWRVNIKFIENEVLKLKSESKECSKYLIQVEKVLDNNIKSRTDMLTNNLIQKEINLFLWFSNDEKHIPIKAKYVMFPFSLYWDIDEYWHK